MTQYLRPCLAELVGTFFLVFIGAGSICLDKALPTLANQPGIGLIGIALAHGLALSIGVSATMNVSGGHLNPAVTICMWVYKKIETDKALFYIAFQLLGALIAAALLLMIFPSAPLTAAKFGMPEVGKQLFEGTGVRINFLAIAIEIVLTFILVFTIFGTAVDPRAPKIGGFGIGLAVAADILVGGPLTGAAMNPARAFGPALFNSAVFQTTDWVEHLTYWIGPIVGAILAGGLYINYIMEPAKAESGAGHK